MLALLINCAALSLSPGHARVATCAGRVRAITALEAPAAVDALRVAQSNALERITSALSLYSKDAGSVQLDDGATATVRPFLAEAPTKSSGDIGLEESRLMAEAAMTKKSPRSDVAWCSLLSAADGSGSLDALTVWCTPTVGVPHYYCRAGVSADGGAIELSIDLRPRSEAGYETRQADGAYPEPTSREMFMLGSKRMEFAEDFFTAEAEQWADGLRSLGEAAPFDALPGI